MNSADVIVIGAGASGFIAAGIAAQQGKSVLLIEKKTRPAIKLSITGKGRCNVTNNCDRDTLIKSVPTNSRFLYSAFSAFTPQDTMQFFEENGVPLKTERGNRVFPVSDRSIDIIDCLFKQLCQNGVKLVNEKVTELIIEDSQVLGVKTETRAYYSDSVLLRAEGVRIRRQVRTVTVIRLLNKRGIQFLNLFRH